MEDATVDLDSQESQDIFHFLVAVDFGTTFSSVAYVGYSHEHQRRHLTLGQIEMVDAFPLSPHRNLQVHDVPTELWYPSPGQIPHGTRGYPSRQQGSLHQTQDAEDGGSDSSSDSDSDSDSTSDPASTTCMRALPSLSTTFAPTPWLYWGYEVPHQVKEASGQFDHSKRLARFKLLLDEKARPSWLSLQETCRRLIMTGLIETEVDLIAHYLEHLFRHTRDRLMRVGYTADSNVEFVLCVPAGWKGKPAVVCTLQ